MTKLTTEITIEELQYRIHAHENDLTQMWTADYFLNVQKELLALKQEAKNPVAWTDSDELEDANKGYSAYLFGLEGEANKYADPRRKIMLYAAPVLPLLSIGELLHRLEEQTGEKWVEESERPVIPEQPKPTISFYRDGIIAAAKWVENQRDAYDNEHGQSDPDTGAFEFGNDAQLEYSTTLSEIAEGIRSLHPTSAQPVSEPYKLKDAVEDIRNSGVEIDADKIKAERDTLNSPVIPEGWMMVPIEPTAEMAQAARDCHEGESFLPYSIYRAMLAAAPAQEQK